MAKKNVTSSDPRKPAVMNALKRKSGCRKVTQVSHDTTTNTFSGNCMNPSSPDAQSGRHTVTAEECGL
jgi:hypothetical protein